MFMMLKNAYGSKTSIVLFFYFINSKNFVDC